MPSRISILKVRPSDADVAELVDAQVSEACCRKAVEVRFFSSAPTFQPLLLQQLAAVIRHHFTG
jgi:hypothetical protein